MDVDRSEQIEELPDDVQLQLKQKTSKPEHGEAEDIEVAFQIKRRPEIPDVEETPVHVDFQIKPKKKKPEYQVQDLDEEIAVGYIRRRPTEEAITYEEDSMIFRKPRKPLPSSYLEGYYPYWFYDTIA